MTARDRSYYRRQRYKDARSMLYKYGQNEHVESMLLKNVQGEDIKEFTLTIHPVEESSAYNAYIGRYIEVVMHTKTFSNEYTVAYEGLATYLEDEITYDEYVNYLLEQVDGKTFSFDLEGLKALVEAGVDLSLILDMLSDQRHNIANLNFYYGNKQTQAYAFQHRERYDEHQKRVYKEYQRFVSGENRLNRIQYFNPSKGPVRQYLKQAAQAYNQGDKDYHNYVERAIAYDTTPVDDW